MERTIAEIIDKLVNVEANPNVQGGRTQLRYDAARAKQGDPAVYLAAKGLMENVKPGDYVFFLSGAGASPWLEYGETDGPAGVVSLARAVHVGLGAHPVYIGDAKHLGPVEACGRAAGLLVLDRAAIEVSKARNASLSIAFPLGPDGAQELSEELLESYKPTAVIAVEKQSPNGLGVFHSSRGYRIPADSQAHVFRINDEARRRGIFTIGIGDGGNEIGYGVIHDEYNAIFQRIFNESCACGCGGGQATVTASDVLVTACTSNWGAYGVSAMLAHLLGNKLALQDVETERRMQEAQALAGAVDVLHGTLPYVDGTTLLAQLSIVALLHEIIANAAAKPGATIWPPEYAQIVAHRP